MNAICNSINECTELLNGTLYSYLEIRGDQLDGCKICWGAHMRKNVQQGRLRGPI